MNIKKAILHIFDMTSSLAVYSDGELSLGDMPIYEYIQHHVTKAFRDPACKMGYINEGSFVARDLQAYQRGERTLVEVSKTLGERVFTYLSQSGSSQIVDVIIGEVTGEDTYVTILLCEARSGYTHHLMTEEDGSLTAELIEYRAVLPFTSQRLKAFASISLKDFSVRLYENKEEYDGEKVYILGDKLLEVQTKPSSKSTVATMKKVVAQVSEAYESSGVEELAKTRSYIAENASTSDMLEPKKLIAHVFSDHEGKQEEAMKELAEKHMDEPLPMNREYAQKIGKMHKIKTDTGIEITFPVEYMKNKDLMDITTNPDGTLRIELKNISKIMNR